MWLWVPLFPTVLTPEAGNAAFSGHLMPTTASYSIQPARCAHPPIHELRPHSLMDRTPHSP
ncbi:hypothetical protein BO1005MUT1_520103 [Hyphomicrobiales bacterium]|nr:hypothetical protein BO1005MUT1_520103 [Hyphomicrobiales bacterium]